MISAASEIKRAEELLRGIDEMRPRAKNERTRSATSTRPKSKLCIEAGVSAQDELRIRTRSIAIALLAALLSLLLSQPLVLFVAPLWVLFQYIKLTRKRAQRLFLFERDYPALLVAVASSVRSGADALEAMSRTQLLFSSDSEVKRELEKFTENIQTGLKRDDAIRLFGADIPHPDIRLFTTALLLNQREGASLGDCLHRLTKVIRQRQSFRRKTKAAVAMQKLSAVGIVVASLIIVAMLAAMNPEAFKTALSTTFGRRLIFSGLALTALGTFWMSRLVKTRL